MSAGAGVTVRRATEAVLGLAMLIAVGLIVHATDGQGFAIDELPYYAHVATKDGIVVHYGSPFGLEYLLAPFNGHLQVGGRFVYETVFATIGAHYTAFVLVNALAICAGAGVFFAFARRRLGDVAALAPTLLLLFFGIAREQFLWPFDLHTSVALAAGLGGILSLERGGRRGDIVACLLLTLSASMIELGLAFIVGAALLIAMGPDRFRRSWIVVAPLLLYAIWWIWAHQFGQAETDLSNVVQAPETAWDSLALVLGSLTGRNPTIAFSFATEVTTLGRVLAVLTLVALVARLAVGGLPRTIWVWLVVAAGYWALLAIGGRPPVSTRYLLVSAVLVLLIAVDCFRRPLSSRVGAVLVVLALLPLPANVEAMFGDEEVNPLRTEVPKTRAELAMLELARDRVDPGYFASTDPWVEDAGGSIFQAIPAGAYLDSAAANGSIAYTLPELRNQPEEIRAIADATLAGALDLVIVPASAPAGAARCRTTEPRGDRPAIVPLSAGVNYLRVSGDGAPLIGLRRFAASGGGVPIARLRAGGWASIELPADDATEPWRLVTKVLITTCAISSNAS
jgi:hypothetical protein